MTFVKKYLTLSPLFVWAYAMSNVESFFALNRALLSYLYIVEWHSFIVKTSFYFKDKLKGKARNQPVNWHH